MIFGVIYLLIDGTNDREYVGQTTRTLKKRFKEHTYEKNYIGHAIRSHGKDLFALAVLKVCYSKEELDFWEKYFIKARNTKAPNGYNLTDGGEGLVGCTDETRAKKSTSMSGENHPFFGKHLSPEHRDKISAARKGKPLSSEHCAKLSLKNMGENNPQYGKPRSLETRAKIGAANAGKKRSPEVCSKFSVAKRGYSPYKNLIAELDARQMSYSALAKLLMLTTACVSSKMRLEIRFTDKDKAKLVEIFGKSIEYLLELDESFCAEDSPHRRPSPFKNLIAELEAHQMTYTELARLMDSDSSSISRKIRGLRGLNDKEKNRLVEIFDKPIEYLLQRDDG